MELVSSLARRELDSPLEISRRLFPCLGIKDAIYLNRNTKSVFAISSDSPLTFPYAEALLEEEAIRSHVKEESIALFINGSASTWVNEKQERSLVSRNEAKAINDVIEKLYRSFGYLDDYGSFHLDLDSRRIGPHYDVNLLLGNNESSDEPLLNAPKSVVSAFGGGSFRGKADFQILATRWDVNEYENGNPWNRQVYILEKGRIIFSTADLTNNVISSSCVHSPNLTTITYKTDELKIIRSIFLIPAIKGGVDALECQSLKILSLDKENHHLKLVVTGMFGLAGPDGQATDIIYQNIITESRIVTNKKGQLIAVSPSYRLAKLNRDRKFASLRVNDEFFDSFSMDESSFLGRGNLAHPEGINSLSSVSSKEGASFFALAKEFDLKTDKAVLASSFVGASYNIDDDECFLNKLNVFLEKYPLEKDVLGAKLKVVTSFEKYASKIKFVSSDIDFNKYVNSSLPFQVLYQSFVSRSFAQTQKGYREIGFREIQDLYASMPYLLLNHKEPLVKKMLSKWIENVYPFGYANHNFYYVGKEPGQCSDDALWLVHAISSYIHLSGDSSILDKRYRMAGSSKRRSLKETIYSILLYSSSISTGIHGLPLLDTADWNDCLRVDLTPLNGPNKESLYKKEIRRRKIPFGSPLPFARPESVMNAFLLDIALKEAIPFFSDVRAGELIKKQKALEDNIQKYAYIDGYFARVLLPEAAPTGKDYVGSKGDNLSTNKNIDGSYYLNSFSWSLLANVASEEQIRNMLPIVDKYLRNEVGYSLCTPTSLGVLGCKESSSEHYYEGDRENGGVFKHAAMMFVLSLLKRSKDVKDNELKKTMIDDAFFMLSNVFPYNVMKDPYLYKGNPRFCTQYINPKSKEHIGPILSGTATWLTLALYAMLGVSISKEVVTISPVLPSEWTSLKGEIIYEGKKLVIEISKNKGCYINEDDSSMLNGKKAKFPVDVDINELIK